MEEAKYKEMIDRLALEYGYIAKFVAAMVLKEYGFSPEEIPEQIKRNTNWCKMFEDTYDKFGFTTDELSEAIAINVNYYDSHEKALNKLTGTLINRRKNKWI